MPKLHWRSALLLHYCVLAVVKNVSITVQIGTDGMLVVNVMRSFQINNVHIATVYPQQQNVYNATTNGILVYYYKSSNVSLNKFRIINLTYSQELHSYTGIQTVLFILLINIKYDVSVKIYYCEYKNLHNVSVLYYVSYTDSGPAGSTLAYNEGKRKLYFNELKVHNNSGNGLINLLVIKYHDCRAKIKLYWLFFTISSSEFSYNVQINSVFTILNSSPCLIKQPALITIEKCSIKCNQAVYLLSVNKKLRGTYDWSVIIICRYCTMSLNKNGKSLMMLNTAHMTLDAISITNNSFYVNVAKLFLSCMRIQSLSNVSNNHVRYVLNSMDASYAEIAANSVLKFSQNTVYSVLTTELILKHHSGEMYCFFQLRGYGHEQNISTHKIIMKENFYTAPLHLIDLSAHFLTCKWIKRHKYALNKYKPSDVLNAMVNVTKKQVDKENLGIIPSIICICLDSTNYNCRLHFIDKIFPGQTLKMNLIIPQLNSFLKNSVTITAEVANMPPNGCILVRATEITQLHTNTGCNQYNYTVWSDKSECELYLSTEGIPEIFYVKLLPCPVGFSLQSHLRRCHCDTVLNCDVITVTTCNLDDGTILRPANSWISADTVNGSHKYHVSSHCPFDYCLPHSSYLNLSTPDMQCQFNRSGVLCGHCQQGFSAVFGSSRCKQCSNVYLLIIIPLAIAGILLVITLFVLNLTVTNGAINTFIFYVNIVNANHSDLLPNCYSPICVMLSIFNLDLGIETCFYNNMTDYAKMWLQLAFSILPNVDGFSTDSWQSLLH